MIMSYLIYVTGFFSNFEHLLILAYYTNKA